MVDQTQFQKLAEHLRSLGPFLYYPNPGNGGDSLIALGTLLFFERLRLPYKFFSAEEYSKNKCVVTSGGGGLIPDYKTVPAVMRFLAKDASSVTILPSSCFGSEDTLELMDERFHFFAREHATLAHLQKNTKSVHLDFCHDMAFTLTKDTFDLSQPIPLFLSGQRLDYQIKWLNKRRKILALLRNVPPVTQMLRYDVETAVQTSRHLQGNYDISNLIKGQLLTSKQVSSVAHTFYHIIARQKSIITDRLHIAVAAALAGVPCTMRANNYFKNKAVFDASISGNFPHVQFDDQTS
jgi:exopolysaccharide biosynthesis predicted pyruvyltransferase EpsI